MTNETSIAYVAGLIDGEGCIRVKKSKAYKCQGRSTPGYHASIQIKMTDKGAIEFVASVLGGWHYVQRSALRSGRPLYTWQVSDLKAETAIKVVLPYLRVKKAQAEAVLSLRQLQAEGRKHRTKIVGYRDFPNQYGTVRQVPNKSFSDEYVARCEKLFQACKRLNRVGLAALAD
jgi:hypothetical protein